MIKINLATRKQSASVANSGTKDPFAAFTQGKLGDLKGYNFKWNQLIEQKDLPIRRIVVFGIIFVLAWVIEDHYKTEKIREVDQQIAEKRSRKDELAANVSKIKSYEELKKSLEIDELTFRTKIEAIKKLINGKGESMKALLAFSNSLPDDVWLSELEIKDSDIQIRGYSLKFDHISDFIKKLGENEIFTDVNLKNTQTSRDVAGVSIPSFDISMKRKER